MNDHYHLWSVVRSGIERSCVMVTCCNGAELQIRDDDRVVLRELYPDKATLYERARELEEEWALLPAENL
jgi:hypothetical protein